MQRREQIFNENFPLSIVGILAIIQLLTTLSILSLEIVRIVINIRITNLFAGIWTSIPFTILWISMFATVCCCRRRSCATHAVIQNIISLLFAIALIIINCFFLIRPNECFFTKDICKNLTWLDQINLSWNCINDITDKCKDTRLALIQSQLACAILMFITCLIYLIIYIFVYSRTNRHRNSSIENTVIAPVYQTVLPSRNNYPIPPYVNNSTMYQTGVPGYQPMNFANNNNSYTAMYPQIPTERF